MKHSLTKNYIYNLMYQMLVLIVPLVTMPYVSRVLGDDNIGVFNFIQSLVSYFVLFGCIGLNLYGQREIAACGNDVKKRTKVFLELQIIRTVTVSVALAAYVIGTFVLVKNLSSFYLLFAVEIVASIFDLSWFFQGIEYFKVQALRNLVVKLAGIAGIFLFVKTENDLSVYIICYTAANLTGNLMMWFCLPGNVSFSGLPKLRLLRHIRPALIVFFPQIATSIYAQLDKTMIKFLSDYKQVAYYSQAEKIVKIVLTVVTAMGLVMLSRVASSYSNHEKERVVSYINNSFRFLFLIMWPCTFGLMAISKSFVPWFFGPGYEQVAPCMVVLCPIIVLIGLSNTLGTQYLLPTNQMKYYTISVVCGAVMNLIFNFILIPRFGCLGAAGGTVIAELSVTAMQFWFARDKFKPTILLKGWKSFVSAAVMGGVIMLLDNVLGGRIWKTVLEVVIGAAIYGVLLLVLHDEFLFKLFDRFRKRGVE